MTVSVRLVTTTCDLYNAYSSFLSYTSVLFSVFSTLLKGKGDAVWRKNLHFNFHVIAMLVSRAHFVFEFRKSKFLSLWPYILYNLSQIPDSQILFYATYVAELRFSAHISSFVQTNTLKSQLPQPLS